jgi:hypothetical protein
MTSGHTSAAPTYVIWREEHLKKVSLRQGVHISNLEDGCLLGCSAV